MQKSNLIQSGEEDRKGAEGYRSSNSCLTALSLGLPPSILRLNGCNISFFVHFSCVATKTITLELDAYEKLRAMKKAGESFTEVVRRASFNDAPLTGGDLRTYLRAGGSGVSERYLNAVEEAAKHDPLPDNPWD